MIFSKFFAVTALAAALTGAAAGQAAGAGFDPSGFTLPEDARTLVVVEGDGTASGCTLYAYEKTADGWNLYLESAGCLGENGFSNYRVAGSRTTPIGVWKANTPFGQKGALDGFPKNYIKVDESYVWSDNTNSLEKDTDAPGEKVGTSRYAEYYDYCFDMGYNRNAYPNKGTALFIHCQPPGDPNTAGCVEIPVDKMIELMKLYGKYEDGTMYVACAPKGRITKLYDAYGVCNGLSPDGDF